MYSLIYIHYASILTWYICGMRVWNLVKIGIAMFDFVRKDIFNIEIRILFFSIIQNVFYSSFNNKNRRRLLVLFIKKRISGFVWAWGYGDMEHWMADQISISDEICFGHQLKNVVNFFTVGTSGYWMIGEVLIINRIIFSFLMRKFRQGWQRRKNCSYFQSILN